MCGESTGLVEIIFWRFIQGIGGGALLSTSQAILFDAFEPKRQAYCRRHVWHGCSIRSHLRTYTRRLYYRTLQLANDFYDKYSHWHHSIYIHLLFL